MSIPRHIRLGVLILALILLVSAALTIGLRKTVTLTIDGQSHPVTTYALRVSDLMRSQGIALSPEDELTPSLDAWLSNGGTITLQHAIPVQILSAGQIYSLYTAERLPSGLLAQAGVTLLPADQLLSNGHPVDPSQPFPPDAKTISLQILPSLSFTLHDGSQTQSLASTAASLGQALWASGYALYDADRLSPPAETPLRSGLAATLVRSRLVTIQTLAADVTVRTAAATVGEALEDAGLSLQGLDYSLPSPEDPIPADGEMRLVRVTEDVLIEQTPLAFETQYQPVSDLEIDHQSIIQTGEYGLTAQRVRVRYEDGQEVSRQVESQWVARQPQPRIVGYGTLIVMHTVDTPDGPINYWRSLTVWVTSYHPSETGSNRTATGALVEKGVVSVNPNYIPYYTQMYIPGYGFGTALDTGNIGARWIDLAYTDEEYVPWHEYVTIYFIWPPPDNIVWIIP